LDGAGRRRRANPHRRRRGDRQPGLRHGARRLTANEREAPECINGETMTVHAADLILDPTAERNAPTTGVSATEQALGIVPTSDAAKTADAVLYTYKRAPGEIVRG